MKNADGSYADRVLQAEQASLEFFSLMEMDDNPNMGVLSFEQIKKYE